MGKVYQNTSGQHIDPEFRVSLTNDGTDSSARAAAIAELTALSLTGGFGIAEGCTVIDCAHACRYVKSASAWCYAGLLIPISGGTGETEVITQTITQNGTSSIEPSAGKTISKVNLTVNVAGSETETKTATITQNGTTEINPTAGKTMSKVTVTVAIPTYDGTVETPTLTHLTVTYDNTTPVASGTTLAQLTEVVKAYYSDSTFVTLVKGTTYQLSGTLTAGQTNTVTVTGLGSYASLTAVTFQVTVAVSAYTDYDYMKVTEYAYTTQFSTTDGLASSFYLMQLASVNNTTLEADILFDEDAPNPPSSGAYDSMILGVWNETVTGQRGFRIYTAKSSSSVGTFGYMAGENTTGQASISNPFSQKHTIKLVQSSSDSNTKAYVDNALKSTTSWGSYTSDFSAWVATLTNLAHDVTASSTGVRHKPGTLVYELRIYDSSNTLVGQFVPKVRNSDNAIGWYNKVDDSFVTTSTLAYCTIGNAQCCYAGGNDE